MLEFGLLAHFSQELGKSLLKMVGYELHTNNELALMLSGDKPLAMFYAEESELPDESLIPQKAFSNYVNNGIFATESFSLRGAFSEVLARDTRIAYVLYAQKSELWRLQAMKLLREQHNRTMAWNETCERIEGYLLGYTNEQIDEWCDKIFT